MAVKLLATLRLDPSDRFVFERAAEPGEWAVPGGFRFWDLDPESLEGKARQAFRAGFLGLGSFGDSTLAVVVETDAAGRAAALDALAGHLVAAHGAPSIEGARAAAEEEIAFAAALADHPPGTVVALHRTVEAGAVRERFRVLKAAERPAGRGLTDGSFRAFQFVEVEGDEEPAVDERIDLAGLATERP